MEHNRTKNNISFEKEIKASDAKIARLWFALCACLWPCLIFAQVEEAWIGHYDSPYDDSGGLSDQDWGKDIAVDSLGSFYVTGWSPGQWWPVNGEHDFLTIKYDSNGNELWVARYQGGGHDGANAIALDQDTNVYVTGFSESTGAFDYLTLKYDTNGNQLWSARWQGDWSESPAAITVDDQGNAYVTGWTESFGTGTDYLTIKYDTHGSELWVARYNGPGIPPFRTDAANDIIIDSQGNVYVTGRSDGIGTGGDYVTIKYDADGNELWTARYDGAYNAYDEAVALAVDISGEVYATGSCRTSDYNTNYVTIKYDADGNELWAEYSGFGGEASAMSIDRAGHVYVTGWRFANAWDYATIAYDESGNELWRAFYDAAGYSDQAYDIAADVDGCVTVTGYSDGGETDNDIATIKYDTSGNELWAIRFNAMSEDDRAHALALDREGNVCLTGYSHTGDTKEFTTIKYLPTVSLGFTCLTPIVAQGGTLKYEVSVANNSSEPQDIWAWIKEKLPTGEWAEDYLLPPTNLDLVPDQEGTYPLRTPIPLSALLGPHEYWGYIGADTLAVWDCDMFPFSVYYQRHHCEVREK